jgi:hypothetical protein
MFGDIEATFSEFYDASTQEVTADVNNTTTTSQTVNAVDLSVTNAPFLITDSENIRAEYGTATSSTFMGAAADDGWDTSVSKEISVSFNSSFSTTPVVFAEIDTGNTPGGAGMIARPLNSDQSGFDIRIRNYAADSSSSQSVNWLALGPD